MLNSIFHLGLLVSPGKNLGAFGGDWLWPFISEEGRRGGPAPKSKQGCVPGGSGRQLISKVCGRKG